MSPTANQRTTWNRSIGRVGSGAEPNGRQSHRAEMSAIGGVSTTSYRVPTFRGGSRRTDEFRRRTPSPEDERDSRALRAHHAAVHRSRPRVPADAWGDPSPCAGWTARDVVGHLTSWISEFFGAQGVAFPAAPTVEDDPVAAWEAVRTTIGDALADPSLSARPVATPFSTRSLAETVDMIVTGDVFTHTWDLARATGQDETLDPDQVRRMLAATGAMPEEVLRADGMFGPAIEVPDDADDQTKLLAYLGRRGRAAVGVAVASGRRQQEWSARVPDPVQHPDASRSTVTSTLTYTDAKRLGRRTWARRSCRSWSATTTAAPSSCSATSSRSEEQMPLSFAHAHASDNWRISVRGTTNMGRDTYEQGQFRFHDGGVPYASDNFAWGPDGGYGIIMFADRRGFAIRPVKPEIAERLDPQQAAAAAGLGHRHAGPVPRCAGDRDDDGPDEARAPRRWVRRVRRVGPRSAPASAWPPVIAGEPTCGPVLVFLDCDAGCEAVPRRTIGTEVIVAPVSGSVDAAGMVLAPGDVRVEEAGVEQPALVAGHRRCAPRDDLRRPARPASGPRQRRDRRRPRHCARPGARRPPAPTRATLRVLTASPTASTPTSRGSPRPSIPSHASSRSSHRRPVRRSGASHAGQPAATQLAGRSVRGDNRVGEA